MLQSVCQLDFGPIELGGGFEENWLDPVGGIRVLADLSRKFTLLARADVGGFGIGSDLTWNVNAGLDFRASKTVDFEFEYKIMDIDYDSGEDDKLKFFAVDITFQEFLLGINFNF